MRRQIVGSVRAGESVTRIAERLLDIDSPIVRLPRHVVELRRAAEMSLASGDRNVYIKAVKKWESTIERLGATSPELSIRAATKQMVKDLGKAKVGQIDGIVDRWTLERARFQARTIARTEVVQGYRDQAQRQAADKDYVVGFRWRLSPAHRHTDVCLSGSTLVEAIGGQRRIDSLRVGDEVLTHTGRYMPITRVYRSSTPAVGLLRLRFQAGTNPVLEVDATRNHPFATARGWIAAGALNIGDRAACLPGACCMRDDLPGDGSSGIGQSGFPQSEPFEHPRTIGGARCAGPQAPAPGIRTWESASASIATRSLGSGMRRFLQTLQTSWGFLHRFGLSTFWPASHLAFPICQDGVSQNWDSPLPSGGFQSSDGPLRYSLCPRSSSSRIGFSESSSSERTVCRTFHRETALSGARPYSTSASSTCEPEGLVSRMWRTCSAVSALLARHTSGCTASFESCSDHQQSLPPLEASAPSTAGTVAEASVSSPSQSTPDHKTGDESVAFLRQLLQGWDPSSSGISRMPVECLFLGASELTTTDPHVFNLEVAEDHTYFAGGILVHNCDVLASQDLDGLGPGGYLPGNVPSTPHPSDLCSVSPIVDEQHFARARAKRKGTAEPSKPWLSGRKQTGEEWLRAQPDKFQRELLGPSRFEAFQQGKQVLDKTGNPIPVHKVLGIEKRTQKLGPAVITKPIIERDRASMVIPFPRVSPSRN